MDALQAAELATYVEQERRRMAAAETPHLPVVNSGLDPTLYAAQRLRADTAVSEGNIAKYAVIGIPLAMLAMRAA